MLLTQFLVIETSKPWAEGASLSETKHAPVVLGGDSDVPVYTVATKAFTQAQT